MNDARHQVLLRRYREVITSVMVTVESLDESELDYRPAHAGWSARELVNQLVHFVRPSSVDWTARQLIHHIADAEIEDGVRLRRMLAENTPVLQPWDDEHYSKHLHYHRPIAATVEAFRAVALVNIELLEQLSPDEWQREANQEHLWRLTVEDWLEEKLVHLQERMMQIINAVGSPQRDSEAPLE